MPKIYEAHISQIANSQNELESDFTFITLRQSDKSPDFVLAHEAYAYDVDTDEETPVDVKKAINDWAINLTPDNTKLIDGHFAVLCSDKVWRKLIYKNGNYFVSMGF